MKYEVKCSNCGKEKLIPKNEFDRYKNHFCNTKCHGEFISKNKVGVNHPSCTKVEVCCSYCNKKKMVKLSNSKRSENYFCNVKCHGEFNSENKIGLNHPTYSKVEVECDWCGKSKLVRKGRPDNGKNIFCDQKCAGEYKSKTLIAEMSHSWRGGKVKVQCSHCENDIYVFPYKLETYKENFCNIQCRNGWQKIFMTGKNSPVWKGGKSFEKYPKEFNKDLKNIIRERDEFKCQLCGVEESSKKHDCHHIDYNKKNNSFMNFVLLCKKNGCHGKTVVNREYWEQYFSEMVNNKYRI